MKAGGGGIVKTMTSPIVGGTDNDLGHCNLSQMNIFSDSPIMPIVYNETPLQRSPEKRNLLQEQSRPPQKQCICKISTVLCLQITFSSVV